MPVPDLIGSYRIVRPLGRGGQGTVYLAEDERLGRQVALKVLSDRGTLDEGARRRFRREAEAASKLDHPGIATVFEAGVDGTLAYIAMRYIPGDTLASILDRLRLGTSGEPDEHEEPSKAVDLSTLALTRQSSMDAAQPTLSTSTSRITGKSQCFSGVDRSHIERMVRALEQVARAVQVAHEAGVIHRDLKPGNIMITRTGQPVVVDFGLARLESGEASTLTAPDTLLGTVPYMSPEQLAAQPLELDCRTDVYSLGVTLYEALTLRRPFGGATQPVLLRQILTEDPPNPRSLAPAIPRDLVNILDKAMEKPRRRRYATAGALADDLLRFLESRPISARPVGPLGRAWRFARRRPATALLFAVLTFAVPALAGMGGFLIARLPQIRNAQRLAEERAFEERIARAWLELGEGDAEASLSQLRALESDYSGRPEVYAGRVLERLRGNDFDGALALLDAAPRWERAYPGFRELRRWADAMGRKPAAPWIPAEDEQAKTHFDHFLLGTAWIQSGHRGAPGAYEYAFSHLLTAVHASPTPRALYHFELAHAAGHLEDHDHAGSIGEGILSQWGTSSSAWFWAAFVLPDSDAELAVTRYRQADAMDASLPRVRANLARALVHARDPAAALKILDEELQRGRRNAVLSLTRSKALVLLGRTEDALRALRESAAQSPDSQDLIVEIGETLTRAGQYEEAISVLEDATRRDPDDGKAWSFLGLALLREGRHEKAAAALRRAIPLNPTNPTPKNNLGASLARLGRHQESLDAYRDAQRTDPTSAVAYAGVGFALVKLNDAAGAEDAFLQSARLLSDNPTVYYELGLLRYRRGADTEAASAYRRALELNPGDRAAGINLAACYRRMGELENAAQAYRSVVQASPNDGMALRGLTSVLQSLHRWEESLEVSRRAVAASPSNRVVLLSYAAALQRHFLVEDVRDVYEEMLSDDPDDPVALCRFGEWLSFIGEFDEALRHLRRGHGIGTRQKDWAYRSDQWLLEAEALDGLEREIKTVGLDAIVWPDTVRETRNLGELGYRTGRFELAAAAYTRVSNAVDEASFTAAMSQRLAIARVASAAPAEREARSQALFWFNSELDAIERELARGTAKPEEIRERLISWKYAPGLSIVRDRHSALPDAPEWRRLFERVDRVLAGVNEIR